MPVLTVTHGFDDAERDRVGALYWEAFGDKLSAAFRHRSTGAVVVAEALRADRMIVARHAGEVVGACGYLHDGHGAADMTWGLLRGHVSRVEAAWASAALATLRRSARARTLVLDGICVDERHRGRGIGSRLLDATVDLARSHDADAVQLSVVDTNPRAAALYRRHGFEAVGPGSLGPLRHLYGFDGYTTMRKGVER